LARPTASRVQLCLADFLFAQVDSSDGADVAEDARFKLVMDLVPAAANVLERRRVAGTLLYGKCAPHEVEWSRLCMEACGYDKALLTAPFVGYEAYLTAARLTLCGFTALYWDRPPTVPVTPPGMSVVASALDLMCEPRPHEDLVVSSEACIVEDMRRFHLHLSWLSRNAREELLAAWGRLQASGVIARRDLESGLQANASKAKKVAAKAQADADARGLRSCAHCGAQEVHVAQFKRCAACKDEGALYCSKECQRAAWPAHKAACKAARKAAAAGAAADA
jgi:hypothetical protein